MVSVGAMRLIVSLVMVAVGLTGSGYMDPTYGPFEPNPATHLVSVSSTPDFSRSSWTVESLASIHAPGRVTAFVMVSEPSTDVFDIHAAAFDGTEGAWHSYWWHNDCARPYSCGNWTWWQERNNPYLPKMGAMSVALGGSVVVANDTTVTLVSAPRPEVRVLLTASSQNVCVSELCLLDPTCDGPWEGWPMCDGGNGDLRHGT